MKILKFVLALILTFGLLKVASMNSRGRSELVTHTDNGIAFEYNTVPKGLEFTSVNIPLKISGDIDGLTPVLRRTTPDQNVTTALGEYEIVALRPDTGDNMFSVNVDVGQKGKRFYYYFELIDSTGTVAATFTDSEGEPFLFKYIGHVPKFWLLVHIAMIFASVFFISIATVNSVSLIRGGTDKRPTARYFLFAAIAAFLGCYPFGIPMNWFAFGATWEGVPFGTDATDNKTQLLFVYLLFMVLAMFRSVTGKWGRDIFSNKTLGWLGILSFVNMLAIYLIPHSIQFSKQLTYSVCYSYIGFFTVIYLIGWIRSKNSLPVDAG